MAVARSFSGGVVITYALPVVYVTSCLLIMARNRRRKKTYRLKVTRQGFDLWSN